MRKLASVRLINALEAIEGADQIEKAIIDGWEVVVKKGEFKPSDKCVYIEIDSIVPSSNPKFEFLEPRRYRVRTIKLRKQVSQGIAFPLHELDLEDTLEEGTDLTERLGIQKYDPELKKENLLLADSNKKKNPVHKFLLRYSWYRKLWTKQKGWPAWVAKTDEERIQNIPSILRRYADAIFYETEKLDGQSATFFYKKVKGFAGLPKWLFGVCSRNIWLKTKHTCNYWKIADQYDLEAKMKKLKKEIVIQGEIIGGGIQKDKYNLGEGNLDFYVFNVYNIETDEWYGLNGTMAIASALGLKMVPVLSSQMLKNYGEDVKAIVEHVKGNSTLAKVKREGSVFRQLNTEQSKRGISFKAINPDFLLKFDD